MVRLKLYFAILDSDLIIFVGKYFKDLIPITK